MNLLNLMPSWLKFNEGGIQIYNIPIAQEKINNFFTNVAVIVFIIIGMCLVIKIGSHIIEKTVRKQSEMRISLDERKAKTLGAVLISILRYLVYFFGISAILTRIFGTLTITLASIGGVAIGFGAQGFIKDVINGFFILFENQFAVGEYVDIENKSGIVESVELRITRLRDLNGDLHIIQNGLITKVTNHSRGDIRIVVDVDIAYEESIDNAIKVLEDICNRFKLENENIVEGPTIKGVTHLKESGVTIRVAGKAKPMTQWECENKLRKEVKEALMKAGVKIPYPKEKTIES